MNTRNKAKEFPFLKDRRKSINERGPIRVVFEFLDNEENRPFKEQIQAVTRKARSIRLSSSATFIVCVTTGTGASR